MRGRLAWLAVAWGCSGVFNAVVASEPNSAWVARAWQLDDSLPNNNVTGAAQTPEGYVWLSTHRGLVRFDGVRFQSVDMPGFSTGTHPLIRAMSPVYGKEVWLGLEGGAAVGFRPGASNAFTVIRGLSGFRPQCVVQDGDGAVWVGYSDASAWRIADGKVTRFGVTEGLEGTGNCWLATDINNQLWFALADRVGVFRQGRFRSLVTLPEKPAHIGRARAAGVWICAGRQLFKYAEAGGLAKLGELPAESAKVEASVLFEERAGALWVGTRSSGLFRYDGTAITRADTSHHNILCLTEDREGNIWAGTAGGGLNRLRPRVLQMESKSAGLPFEAARSLCEDASGTIWAVGENGRLARRQGGVWRSVSAAEGWTGPAATCVAADQKGAVWIGTYLGGLYRWEGGAFTALTKKDGLASDIIHSVMVDSRGDLWIGLESQACVQQLHQGQLQTYAQPKDNPIRAMAEDASGTIWLATSEHLLRVSGDSLVDETRNVLWPPRPIRCLYATADGSLWTGYASAGVGRFRAGRSAIIGVEQGLHDDYICAMTGDGKGALWFGSDHGIFEVRLSELEAVAEGRAQRVQSLVYGRDQSLPNLQANYGYAPGSIRGRDGRLWFPMSTGVVMAHPERVQPNVIPPPVLIERVAVDGHTLDLASSRTGLVLPPGHRNLELEFTALSFAAPESVRLRHRLEGWDEGWIETGPQRRVSYSRLPAGNYVFRVIACNEAGIWNEEGARLAFRVRPFLWQTWWFRVAGALGLAGLATAGVRTRERRRHRRELERLERQTLMERERARVAQDLHDDLGAGLTEIGLLGSLAQRQNVPPERAQQHLNQITNKAREMVTSLDEIVWAINPKHDSLASLSHYFCEYAQHFLELTPIRCRIEVASDLPSWPLDSEQRHNLFLAFKEALTNVARHSRASEARIRISAPDGTLVVAVEDDGEGMTTTGSRDGADGLANMSQRLAQVGGRCEIQSTPGTGTTVRFTLPRTEPPF